MMYASNDAQIFGLICSVYGVSFLFFLDASDVFCLGSFGRFIFL